MCMEMSGMKWQQSSKQRPGILEPSDCEKNFGFQSKRNRNSLEVCKEESDED